MRRVTAFVFWALLFAAAVPAVPAESHDFIDTAPARQQWFDEIVDLARPDRLVSSQVISGGGAPAVEVRIDHQLGNRYHIFLRHSSPPAELAGPGTVVVRQRRFDGAIDQMKVFLQHDEGTFFRLRPRPNRRTLEMDLYLAGSEFYRDVTVPISLERAVRAPISEIQRLTAGIVDWEVARPHVDRPEYAAVAEIVSRVRRELPRLADADDGAMGTDGSIVSIESLTALDGPPGFNCSGFAKWIVDGLYQSQTGDLIPIERLKEKHLDHRGTRWSRRVEETRDPYFGLDWTRNLARELYAADRRTRAADIDPEARDVRSVPTARYREDVGFPVEDLRGILYWLAVKEPGMIYLGSVNGPSDGDGTHRQHSHVVVLLPYFTDDGRFHSVVMERTVETGLEQLIERSAEEFIHLVRIDGTIPFETPERSRQSAR
ncbi:MAG: hypothetical protein ACOCYB_09385 [Alkalispirochaeta sp.]